MTFETVLQIIIFIILLIIIYFLFKVRKNLKLKMRFDPFVVKLIEDDSKSVSDKLNEKYQRFLLKNQKLLENSLLFSSLGKIYEKIFKKKDIRLSPMLHVTKSFIVGNLFVLIYIISNIIFRRPTRLLSLLLIYVLFSFLPNFFLILRLKNRKEQVNENMLHAIIIMNNAFKSGMSIIQAIHIVYEELDGGIKDEFLQMYKDISLGLNMDLVFQRFATRVNTKEARNIAASLSVLNKTGGDISKVFQTVEKSAFNRKKLQDELKSISASAKMMFYILIIIPIILGVSITLINPGYFNIFFENALGIILFSLTLILYLIYVFLIHKIITKEVM